MATGIYSWSQTAATNNTADAAINFSEGQAPSTLNDSCRGVMSVLSRWRDDLSGVQPSNVVQTSGGAANAQTLTTNLSIAALTNGWTVAFKAGFSNTSSCTMHVDSLGAKSIYRLSGTALLGGEIKAGAVYTITYHQPVDAWMLHSAANGDAFASGTAIVFYQASAPTGWTAVAQNNKALRVVSSGGTGGTAGGTTAFTSVFTSRTVAQANLPNVNFTVSGTAATHTHGLSTVSTSSDGAHTHTYSSGASVQRNSTLATLNATADFSAGAYSTGSSGAHTHTLSGNTDASGTLALTATAASGGSGTALDFAVQYVDVIIATKD
jgi:hypothetical protein